MIQKYPIFYGNTSTDTYVKYYLGEFVHITLCNDSVANPLEFSYDAGVTVHGILLNEQAEFRDVNQDAIYIKSRNVGAPCNFRLFAYGDRNLIYPNANKETSGVNSVPLDFRPFTFQKKII
ncbi:MAG: hypothetical protein M0P71_16250 [Melioribacteraceae bacterium]|jgi:hypothetical protein|nr:hypothetical protein [Melioribacteraceae bacterium]